MNDTQFYISVAVTPATTFVIVMIGVLLNNARLSDLRDLLRAEIAKGHSELLAKFAELDNRIDAVSTRLSRIEERLHMN